MIKLIIGIIVVFYFSGCASSAPKYTKINNFDNRIEMVGVSVLPPQEYGWYYYKEHKGKVILGKAGSALGETFAGMIVLSKLPNFDTKEEFLHIVSKQRKLGPKSQRYVDLVNEEKLAKNSKIMKVKFHTKYKDFEPKILPTAMKYLIIEDFGSIFRHPYNKNIAITVVISQRSSEKNVNNNFKDFAYKFIDSIKFKSMSIINNKDFDKGLVAYDHKDYKTALKYWKPLVKQGDAVAQNNLGTMYSMGQGVSKNYKKAVKHYMLSAKQGYLNGQLNLGASYEHGEGIKKDYAQAFKWYQLSAKQGNPQAQLNLGLLYVQGYGVQPNEKKAYEWWKKSSIQGNTWAKKNLDRLCNMSPSVCK